jgi:hypothetical protein
MECADENAAGAKREDYAHVRAKRGQATNSHSLAERVIFFSLLSNIVNAPVMSRSLAYSSMPIRTAVSKGKDKCKDEASSRPCPGLQQGMDGHGADAYAHTNVVMVCTF